MRSWWKQEQRHSFKMAHQGGKFSSKHKEFFLKINIFIIFHEKELVRIHPRKIKGRGDFINPQKIKMQVLNQRRKLQTILLFHGRNKIESSFLPMERLGSPGKETISLHLKNTKMVLC